VYPFIRSDIDPQKRALDGAQTKFDAIRRRDLQNRVKDVQIEDLDVLRVGEDQYVSFHFHGLEDRFPVEALRRVRREERWGG
jgi:hypothetical protein